MKKVFIDGSAGTTGLRIHERISARNDLSLITLPEKERKDNRSRARAINAADVVFLCLPDEAARQALTLCENPDTVILDTSTAHRTDPRFAYGFPELSDEHAERVKGAKRIAVPGCHASGYIALVRPLVQAGLIAKSEKLTCFSLTGYSGGGKKMIAQYTSDTAGALRAPRQYALGQSHKHLPEMRAQTGLDCDPVFCPIVGDFYAGMEVTVALHAADPTLADRIREVYRTLYPADGIVHYTDRTDGDGDGFLSAEAYGGRDDMEISVCGNAQRILLLARYDNLGKGASGAAVECMNIVLGCDPAKGLTCCPADGGR